LASLALNCEANPEACAQAASVNSYEGAVAEPQSDAFDAYNSWLSSKVKRTHMSLSQEDLLQQLGVDCSQTENAAAEARCKAIRRVNKYENKERMVYHHRVAEEAGPQYIGVSDLDLDCTDVALDVQMECERSRAANKYEYEAHVEVRLAFRHGA
jgi:transcriptional regulator with XRE-family HTH domain